MHEEMNSDSRQGRLKYQIFNCMTQVEPGMSAANALGFYEITVV